MIALSICPTIFPTKSHNLDKAYTQLYRANSVYYISYSLTSEVGRVLYLRGCERPPGGDPEDPGLPVWAWEAGAPWDPGSYLTEQQHDTSGEKGFDDTASTERTGPRYFARVSVRIEAFNVSLEIPEESSVHRRVKQNGIWCKYRGQREDDY